MGARGPARIPTRIQILKGDPGKRAVKRAKTEMKPPISDISCPEWMDDIAREEWERVLKVFDKMEADGQKVITALDRPTMEGYCLTRSILLRAEQQLQKDGEVFSTPKGYQMPSPYVAIRNRALQMLKVYSAELGFSPASRSRVSILPNGAEEDELEMILGEEK